MPLSDLLRGLLDGRGLSQANALKRWEERWPGDAPAVQTLSAYLTRAVNPPHDRVRKLAAIVDEQAPLSSDELRALSVEGFELSGEVGHG
jgi:hypothetical protein